jgi:ankyrin repeat protein
VSIPTIAVKRPCNYVACRDGNKQALVEQLLEAGVNPNARSAPNDATALHIACLATEDSWEIISCLLRHVATSNLRDCTGLTPLHYAVKGLANITAIVGINGEH